MKEILRQILEWPVIIQGALGSALFWMLLEFLRWTCRELSMLYGDVSKQTKRRLMTREYVYLKLRSHGDQWGQPLL